jgi:hypothetical protein
MEYAVTLFAKSFDMCLKDTRKLNYTELILLLHTMALSYARFRKITKHLFDLNIWT